MLRDEEPEIMVFPYAKLDFGTHLGKDLDKGGFFYRLSIGTMIPIFKRLNTRFEVLYSYQDIYKTFENRPYSYYNLESIGFAMNLSSINNLLEKRQKRIR